MYTDFVELVKKVFDGIVWVMFFGLLLLGGVIYISNRTYPGDKLYPSKLKFEGFALATSKILNKQVDFSIDLVIKRSNEVAKILTPKNSTETLDRLNTQVESTAISISQISDPVKKKKAAEKYITKLNEVSSVLSEKQKEFVAETQTVTQPVNNISIKPTGQVSQNIIPTVAPAPEIATVSEQINNTQQTIQQTIKEMTNLATDSNITPTKKEQQKEHRNQKDNDSGKETYEEKGKNKNDNDFDRSDDSENN